MSDRPAIGWKVLTTPQMEDFLAQEVFHGAPVDLADGYIHLSTEDQLAGTLDKHFAGQSGLWLAGLDLAALGDTVRWEVSRGGAEFPHVYALLPHSAVVARGPVMRGDDGGVILPALA